MRRRVAGDAVDCDAEALHGDVKSYFRLFFLCPFVLHGDTASEAAAAELRDMAAAEVLPLYGDRHQVRISLSNVLSSLFFALPVHGMPLDSNGTERAPHSLLGTFEVSHSWYRQKIFAKKIPV